MATLQRTLAEQLSLAREGAKPVDLDNPIGRVSRIDAIQQQQMAAANRRNLQLRARLVEQALSAFERAEYGDCRSCEEPIGYGRLKAKPETPLCLNCASARER